MVCTAYTDCDEAGLWLSSA